MEISVLFLICVAINSVNGQFLGIDYAPDRPYNEPLPMRRRLSSARYEIQPSISREIEYQAETTRNSNQGRRHIENYDRDYIQNGQNNRDVNNFENKPSENIYQNRNYETLPADTRTNGHEQLNYDTNTGSKISRNSGENNPTVYDLSLKTNLDSKHLHNTQPPLSKDTFYNQPNYPLNSNTGTNDYFTSQQSASRDYENSRTNEPPARTNANNRNIVKASPSQEIYNKQNYSSNDNVRPNVDHNNQQIARAYENSKTNNDDKYNNKNSDATIQRAINNNNYENRQSVDSTRVDNRNDEDKRNKPNTNTRKKNGDRNYESNRQSTESSRRTTIEDRVVTAGTKSTQDNELASRTHPEGISGTKDDDKWIWDGRTETSTKSSVTTLPAVDDRAAFNGDKCPTGQVRFNNMCVNKD